LRIIVPARAPSVLVPVLSEPAQAPVREPVPDWPTVPEPVRAPAPVQPAC
jgi:hypothetical protein